MPDLKPGYNPIRKNAKPQEMRMTAVKGDSNDV
jgi:hypothetical protein